MERVGATFAVVPGDDGEPRGDPPARTPRATVVVGGPRAAARSIVRDRESLEDALAAILLTDDGFVAVFDGPSYRGVLTPDAIYRALRTSRHPDDD